MEFSIRQDELDKWNNGVLEFHLSYGQSVVLNIEENLSTGYCWELANNELNGFFTVVDMGNSDANYGALDGASTEHSYRLIAGSATGSGKFTAEYSRSWETSPFRTLSFTVNVNQRPEEVPEGVHVGREQARRRRCIPPELPGGGARACPQRSGFRSLQAVIYQHNRGVEARSRSSQPPARHLPPYDPFINCLERK